MDVIRCDESEYLIWKWTPSGNSGESRKENSIRCGSRLRVKDGEVAVFFYKKDDGTVQDYIVGPYDAKIDTANFPILASILGLAFAGETPFQAEVYFINLQQNNVLRFGVPYFDVFDPRFLDFPVPIAVRGTITFSIVDYQGFIKNNRLMDLDMESFLQQVRDAIQRYVKSVVITIPGRFNIPVLQIESKIAEVNDALKDGVINTFEEDYCIKVKRFDISAIEINKTSSSYQTLYSITAQQQESVIKAQTEANIKNIHDTQRINAVNMEESLRIQREETQRAQRLQSESNFIGAHALDQQTAVLQTAAGNLGQMGSMSFGDGGSMNPAGMMTGMMMGGAMGGQMANMMQQMGGQMQQSVNMPPPMPVAQYYLVVNGQQCGPFELQQLSQLIQQGTMSTTTLVWRKGLSQWIEAGSIEELAKLFVADTPPPVPPIPPTL